MHVSLVVDNPRRDLGGLVLVAVELVRRGHKVSLVSQSKPHEIWALCPDVVVFNYLRTTNAALVQQAQQLGMATVILETEGGVFLNGIEKRVGVFDVDPAIRQHIRRVCAWGNTYADYILAQGFYRPDQLVITGTPRYDYYAPVFHAVALQVSETHAHAYTKPLLLITTNFSVVNPKFNTREGELALWVSKFKFEPAYVEEMQQEEWNAMEVFLPLANRIAEAFPALTVVVRPHPFENLQPYRERLAHHLPNLHCETEGTVDGWLLRCSALLHWRSSTAIEAAMLGIPVLNPSWVAGPTSDEVQSISDQIPTESLLMERIAQVIEGSYTPPADYQQPYARIIQQSFNRIDGQAYGRVADVIDEIAPDQPLSQRKPRTQAVAYGTHASTSGRSGWLNRARQALRLPTNLTSYELRQAWATARQTTLPDGKQFSMGQVTGLVEALTQEGGALHGTSIKVHLPRQGADYCFPFINGRAVVLE